MFPPCLRFVFKPLLRCRTELYLDEKDITAAHTLFIITYKYERITSILLNIYYEVI